MPAWHARSAAYSLACVTRQASSAETSLLRRDRGRCLGWPLCRDGLHGSVNSQILGTPWMLDMSLPEQKWQVPEQGCGKQRTTAKTIVTQSKRCVTSHLWKLILPKSAFCSRPKCMCPQPMMAAPSREGARSHTVPDQVLQAAPGMPCRAAACLAQACPVAPVGTCPGGAASVESCPMRASAQSAPPLYPPWAPVQELLPLGSLGHWGRCLGWAGPS